MGRCEMCGNDYDKSFRITTTDRQTREFDSFECAIHALAPECAHCGCKIIGHGVEGNEKIYCCAHCARQAGLSEIEDRASDEQDQTSAGSEQRLRAVEDGMNVPPPTEEEQDKVYRTSEQSFPASDLPSF